MRVKDIPVDKQKIKWPNLFFILAQAFGSEDRRHSWPVTSANTQHPTPTKHTPKLPICFPSPHNEKEKTKKENTASVSR